MSSKIFTSNLRVLKTPVKASDLANGEIIMATDAEGGLLFTFCKNGKETIYDASECPPDSVPIQLPPYKEITDSK